MLTEFRLFWVPLALAIALEGGLASAGVPAEDPQQLAQATTAIIRQNCLHCHGESGTPPSAGFGFILNFERLRATPDYIDLNDPPQSGLYQKILTDEMPYGKRIPKLSEGEKKTILKWIQAGAPSVDAGLALGHPASAPPTETNHSILGQISEDLKSLAPAQRKDVRYLSLAHMPVAGDSPADIRIFREALDKLVNSLSFEPTLYPLPSIDGHALIYRVDLKQLGWSSELWDQVGLTNPYWVPATDEITRSVQTETGTAFPYFRGDWFASVASKPPFYYQFLNIADSDTRLEKEQIGIDVDQDIVDRKILRAGFTQSGVSNSNRMIERHETRFGAYWKSYDFKESTGTSNILERPRGPGNGQGLFSHAAGEIIFNLPNGLQAYLLTTANHQRLDQALIEIAYDHTPGRDPLITNGISCMYCHAAGMRVEHLDQVRDYVIQNPVLFGDSEREEIFATYRDNAELRADFSADKARYFAALKNSGVSDLSGAPETEPVNFLVDRFNQNVDVIRAAAELGVDLTPLRAKAAGSPELAALISRLGGKGVPRNIFSDFFAQMASLVSAEVPTQAYRTNDLGMTFAPIPAGIFQMGSPDSPHPEPDRKNDETLHTVTLTRGFEMGTTPVTQAQWLAVMATVPSHFTECTSETGIPICPHRPVEQVSYNEVQDFIGKLNSTVRDGYKYRLPSEAEWEFAARARAQTAYAFGESPGPDYALLKRWAWTADNSGDQTHDVADPIHPPNAFGLSDMIGNVWQWVADVYEPNYGLSEDQLQQGVRDPQGPPAQPNSLRVFRGGSWVNHGPEFRSAFRNGIQPNYSAYSIGFRLVRTR